MNNIYHWVLLSLWYALIKEKQWASNAYRQSFLSLIETLVLLLWIFWGLIARTKVSIFLWYIGLRILYGIEDQILFIHNSPSLILIFLSARSNMFHQNIYFFLVKNQEDIQIIELSPKISLNWINLEVKSKIIIRICRNLVRWNIFQICTAVISLSVLAFFPQKSVVVTICLKRGCNWR